MVKCGRRVKVKQTGQTGRALRRFPRKGEMLDVLLVVRLDWPNDNKETLDTFYEHELEVIPEEQRAGA